MFDNVGLNMFEKVREGLGGFEKVRAIHNPHVPGRPLYTYWDSSLNTGKMYF